ncbi:hypothetical protein HWQ46_03885 [Shewanella sp. D64]|uniref:hypothetical protein n=1 Tax=unclassified Shewanella TaxID=196818 RepID=UPI0022BA6ED0|nr:MULTISPECIES: hypothetical protein [unclassified Shewanella]MEC4724687.1 hypothetical protein [Shewanella sp. D64]MEC4736519.1 hypothetical protein [Shewanella sp. E94]WBJ97428.1 hypothetical protein HWQ47_10260 [Shewanella sp. MTB7]
MTNQTVVTSKQKNRAQSQKSVTEQLNPLGIIIAFTLIGLVGGCGGGDGGGEAISAPITTPDPDPVTAPTSLDDLVIAADNIIESSYQLDIDVAMNNQQRAYFSLCGDYQVSGSSYKVDYDSCLYRGPLDEGNLSANIKVANHQSKLMVVIWHYDGSAPSYQLWQYDTNLEQQSLTMNE